MQYIKNGNFSDGFNDWQGQPNFDPEFKPYGDGNSVRLPIATSISQTVPDLPGRNMRIKFDVKSADSQMKEVTFAVSVGGFNADGVAQVSPMFGVATQDWQQFSMVAYFSQDLTHCFVNASTSRPADAVKGGPSPALSLIGPVRFGNFSLVEAEPS